MNAKPTALITNQQTNLYSHPLNNGKSDIPCAIPIVNGLKIAPAKPRCAATYTRQSPVIESYPIDIASGTNIITKAMVSSLIPKMAPKALNNVIISTIMMLFTPIFCRNLRFSSLLLKRRNEFIPAASARLSFRIQKLPPTSRMKAIIPACFLNPSKMEVKTCQVCGLASTSW